MKDLLRTEHLSARDVNLLLDTAATFADNPFAATETLAHQTVAIYMTKPSTRTRLASETAVAHLGGTPVFLRGDDLQLGRGETISDTAKIISGFASALIVRTFKQSDVDELGAASSIPVINALTDDDHPTQLLADWITIREKFGKDISGRKFTYVGDGNNMAHAWLTMGAIMGAHVVAATPSGKWAPDPAAVAIAQKIAATTGAKVEVVHDARAGAEGASVLYTDVWVSMGREEEAAFRQAQLSSYQIHTDLVKQAKPGALVMHCLPAYRGKEITAEVFEQHADTIFTQAENRLHAQKAILSWLVG